MTNFTVFLQLFYNSFMTVNKLPDMLYTVQAGYEAHNARSLLWDAGRPWNTSVVHYITVYIIVEAFFRTDL